MVPSLRTDSTTRTRWYDYAVVAVIVVPIVARTPGLLRDDPEWAWAATILGVAGAVSLLCVRRRPQITAVVVPATLFAYLAAGLPGGPVLLPGPVAAAALGLLAPRGVALGGAMALSVAVVAGQWVGSGVPGTIAIAGPAWAFALTLGGNLLAQRGVRRAAAQERAKMLERQKITEQRLAIARDLHDSVAHALVTINVQSGVAAPLIERKPAHAAVALEAIRQASSEVLDEMSAILAALREPGEGAALVPAQRLCDVDTLVERSRADGLDVVLQIVGDPLVPLPAISAASYRVVQEALSNVRRHSGPGVRAAVSVEVGGPRQVRISVVDDGGRTPGPSTPGTGLGLIGMRERVTATGGSLAAGPHGSGFSVVAQWD